MASNEPKKKYFIDINEVKTFIEHCPGAKLQIVDKTEGLKVSIEPINTNTLIVVSE